MVRGLDSSERTYQYLHVLVATSGILVQAEGEEDILTLRDDPTSGDCELPWSADLVRERHRGQEDCH